MNRSTSVQQKSKKQTPNVQHYDRFDQLDGDHPYKEAVPEAVVEYPVRTRHGGKVTVFNFDLAKEMGLIPKSHPQEMNAGLEKKILETFSLVIINEYDEMNNISFPKKDIRSKTYMATRYLQLQHPNKQGKTSGDGRSIWNGQVRSGNRVWDVSSCGTGATRLSPATHINNKFYQTGDPSISYGCGYAEVEEGLETFLMSEIFERNKLKTERVLAIIEFENGISINVRAHENLLRPSHFFWALKQGERETLEKIFHYYLDQRARNDEPNGPWSKLVKKGVSEDEKLTRFLELQCETFAKLSARFESDYIFCWLDWDGDNILMDGGVIDYGSVRQFGLYHHEYRFDDVQRYSTTIKEQKLKAKYTVQTFAQMVDFLARGKKKSIKSYGRHGILKEFDRFFELHKQRLLLQKVGLEESLCESLLEKHRPTVKTFHKAFEYFEMAKSERGVEEVADGVNWSAVFCMRDILRELPQILLARGEKKVSYDEFFEILKSSYAIPEDLEQTPYRRKKAREFQNYYWSLMEKAAEIKGVETEKILLEVTMRSSVINRYDRVTGDSITNIVNRILKEKSQMDPSEIQELVKTFVQYQNFDPDKVGKRKSSRKIDDSDQSKLVKQLFKIVRDYREGL